MKALIGYSGFIGSTLCRHASFEAQFNSKNIADMRHRSFELVVCAGLPAAKWLANRDPEGDTANMQALCDTLETVEADRFVLISTIDVFPRTVGMDESTDCQAMDNHAYGRNRLIFENYVASRYRAHNTIRLPALFGHGLKKNVIFDLIHDNCLDAINPASSFQWYDTERLWSDILLTIEHDVALVGLMSEPIVTGQIIEKFFPDKVIGERRGPVSRYDIRTRFADLFGGRDGYIMGKEETFARMGRYVEAATSLMAV